MVEDQKQKILLIEDNPADIETVRRAIGPSDFEAHLSVIKSGGDAKRKLQDKSLQTQTQGYELILLDLNLPGNDGRELLKHFNTIETWSDVPIVVLTTSGNNEDIQHAYQNGANAYVVKPGSHEQFVETIQSACDFLLNIKTAENDSEEN